MSAREDVAEGALLARSARAEAAADRDLAAALLRLEESPAYGALCRRVHGRDLCQYDALDELQLAALVSALDLAPGDRALDLGCGVGVLTEHLAQRTGARFVGVDRLAPVVERACERAASRPGSRSRRGPDVGFVAADLRALAAPASVLPFAVPVDGIAVVDTLYFVAELPPLVAAIRRWLAPGGRAAILASELLPEGGRAAEVVVGPEQTRLGRALAGAAGRGLSLTATDFTAAENALWERLVAGLHELREAFAAEGALDLWRSRLAEAERSLAWARAGRIRRWLYRVMRA